MTLRLMVGLPHRQRYTGIAPEVKHGSPDKRDGGDDEARQVNKQL